MNKELFLQCLENAGVDNWEGYTIAQDEYNKQIKEAKITNDFANIIDDLLSECEAEIIIQGDVPNITYNGDIEAFYKIVKDFVIKVEEL